VIGVISVGAFCVVVTGLGYLILKKTIGIRVSEEEELAGLDMEETRLGKHIRTNGLVITVV
jgi:Amt family ammonium transporter